MTAAIQQTTPRHDPASQVGRILKHLRKHGRITNIELIQHHRILRGSERIRELRREGHLIRSVRLSPTVWAYIYDGHEDDQEAAA